VHDKETFIRVQAAVALSKLCGTEDVSDLEEDEQSAMDILLDTLSCDPAACVSSNFPVLLINLSQQ
jgi:condensin complex subunit 3